MERFNLIMDLILSGLLVIAGIVGLIFCFAGCFSGFDAVLIFSLLFILFGLCSLAGTLYRHHHEKKK